MKKKFEMVDLGMMKYFLGLEVTQTDKGIFIYQHKYATDILQRFRMDECKPVETPIALVIQEDIGGHPPIPLRPPPLFL